VKFLIDHDVPDAVGHLLRYWGHDVVSLREALPVTTADREVFEHAQTEGRTIISCNRAHFMVLAEQAVNAQRPFTGLIILIRRRSRQAESAHLLSLLRQAGESGLVGNINFA
jgi:predicted nuclease of predicted toxin-antitoxin system